LDKALAIEENGAEFLMALGRAAGAEERDDGQVRWAIGNSPIDYHNCVVHADLTHDEADGEIEVSLQRMRAHGVPGSWHVGPSMRPPDLGECLIAHGFAYGGDDIGMAVDLSELPHDTESGCTLRGMDEKRNSKQSESKRLESLYRKASDPVLRTHLLMVWRMSLGDSVGEVAQMVGYSRRWTTEIARRYESGGVEALGDRRHDNPGAKERALLDEAGEAELLEALGGPPPGGGMWSGPKVARWIAQRNGLEKVHVQRGFEYLRKVRYSPQVPRPQNASADASEREAFKKLSPSG
jgi:transposase